MLRITLGPEENINTILGRIEATAAGEVMLVIPADSPFLENVLDLKFLKKEIESSGVKVRLEAEDERGRKAAEQVDGGKRGSTAQKAKPGSDEPFGFVRGDVVGHTNKTDEERAKHEAPASSGIKGRVLDWISAWADFGWLKRLLRGRPTAKFGIVGGILLVVGLGIFSVYWFFPSATVHLVVSSDSLVKSVEVTADPGAEQVDQESQVIPGVLLEAYTQQTLTAGATGEKEVGEKAIGQVRLYNKTTAAKSLGAGTVLVKGRVEGEDLLFVLKDGVEVPAAVEDPLEIEPPEFGKVEVEVEAVEIGEEYNIGKDETLTVGDYSTSELIASTLESFAGGSRQLVTVVTEGDRAKLSETLQDALEEQVREELSGRTVGDQVLATGAMELAMGTPVFDHSVGEEAATFNLTWSASAVGMVYSQADLEELAWGLLADFVPENYQLSEKVEDRQVDVTRAEVTLTPSGERVLKITAKIQGFVMPLVEAEAIRENLAGRSFKAVEAYLSSVSNIESYRIRMWPPLPQAFLTLPHVPERITVEIERK